LHNCKIPYVRATRYTLGFIYNLNPDIIYANDTPESLARIARRPEPPLRFQVVLGTAARLGLSLSEQEADQIGSRLSSQTRNVEQLANTLSEEISRVVKSKGGQSLSGPADSDTEQGLPDDHEKPLTSWKFSNFMAVFGALIAFRIAYDRKTDFFTLSTLVTIAKGAAVGFVVGQLLWIIGSLLKTRLLDTDKNKNGTEEINLDELYQLADKTPAKRYINGTILDIARQGPKEITFYESKPIPARPEFKAEELPSFAEVLNKIKKFTEFDTSFSQKPRQKILEMLVEKKPVNIIFEVCDGAEEAYVTLRSIPQNETLTTHEKSP
jgi:hypothetical protein